MVIKKINLINSFLFIFVCALLVFSCHTNNLETKLPRTNIFSYSVEIFLKLEDTVKVRHNNSRLNSHLRIFTDSANASRLVFHVDSTSSHMLDRERIKLLKEIQESENITTKWINSGIITLPYNKKAIELEYFTFKDELKIYNSKIYFSTDEIENSIFFRTIHEESIEQYKRMLKSIRFDSLSVAY